MESETFGKVAFRGAYKAKSKDRQFRNTQWDIKRYIDPQNDILQVRDSFFQHTQKKVQARKLSQKIAVDLQNATNHKVSFGTSEGETVMVEEFVDEHFMKYINNDGRILKAGDSDIDILKKTDCYCYFFYIKSEGELVVLDIQ